MVKSVYGDNIFREIACYPDSHSPACLERLEDLRELGIREFYYWGSTLIGKFKIIGKGHAGVVVLCSDGRRIGVCKILRTDVRKDSLENEATMMRVLGVLGVSPRLYSFSGTVVFSEHVRGVELAQYLESTSRDSLLRVLARLVEATLILDKLGISHGELSRPARHVLVTRGDNVRIVDFEYASVSRRTRNQSQIFSALFFGRNVISGRVRRVLGENCYTCLREELLPMVKERKSIDESLFRRLVGECTCYSS